MKRKERIALMMRILEREVVSEQQELQTLLRKEGILVTQATLSRDLAAMHVVKRPVKNGISRYTVPAEPIRPLHPGSSLPADCIDDIMYSGQFVVVRTTQGLASAVAEEIDRHRGGIILGTIAGVDTVLVIPADGQPRESVRYMVETVCLQRKTSRI